MIPKYARYEYCIKKSIEFILNENINHFPFDSDDIISKHKWSRLKYSYLASINNCTIDDISEAYESNDGYTIYSGRNYTISYNDCHDSKRRIYFTKLHEIGHIYLNHFLEFNETIIKRSSMTDAEYKVLENEANCFARNVIAPAIIVKQLKLDTPEKISDYFEITHRAAKTRLDLLELDYQYISDIDEVRLLSFWNNYIYKKHCLQCNHSFYSMNAKYCNICGYNKFSYGGNYNMIYDSIELNNKHKAVECPICKNENTDFKGDHCQICGTFITNKCSNGDCGEYLEGDARYCNFCGHESTYLITGLLKEWNATTTNDNNNTNYDSSWADPIDDGDIPF